MAASALYLLKLWCLLFFLVLRIEDTYVCQLPHHNNLKYMLKYSLC